MPKSKVRRRQLKAVPPFGNRGLIIALGLILSLIGGTAILAQRQGTTGGAARAIPAQLGWCSGQSRAQHRQAAHRQGRDGCGGNRRWHRGAKLGRG